MAHTIFPTDHDDAAELARRLLVAAGEHGHDQVATVTGGAAGIGFVIPDELYAAVFDTEPAASATASTPQPEPDLEPELEPEPEPEPADGAAEEPDGVPSSPASGAGFEAPAAPRRGPGRPRRQAT
jgi:hypothetical protein